MVDSIQRGIPGFKVRRVEFCRGTERLMIPEKGTDPEMIPLRLTVVKNRQAGASEVLGPAEEWCNLTKGQQIRKSLPARISLTIFVSKEELGSPKENVEGIPAGDTGEVDVEMEIQGHGPLKCVARHGPGFLNLNGEERS